jgi:hypothetical protein
MRRFDDDDERVRGTADRARLDIQGPVPRRGYTKRVEPLAGLGHRVTISSRDGFAKGQISGRSWKTDYQGFRSFLKLCPDDISRRPPHLGRGRITGRHSQGRHHR